MNIPAFRRLCLLLALADHGNTSQANTNYFKTLKVNSGMVYSNVYVDAVYPDSLMISHSRGMKQIHYKELPASVQQKFEFQRENAKPEITNSEAPTPSQNHSVEESANPFIKDTGLEHVKDDFREVPSDICEQARNAVQIKYFPEKTNVEYRCVRGEADGNLWHVKVEAVIKTATMVKRIIRDNPCEAGGILKRIREMNYETRDFNVVIGNKAADEIVQVEEAPITSSEDQINNKDGLVKLSYPEFRYFREHFLPKVKQSWLKVSDKDMGRGINISSKFRLNRSGEITNLEMVGEDESQYASICREAIINASPFNSPPYGGPGSYYSILEIQITFDYARKKVLLNSVSDWKNDPKDSAP